ncbi:hypothetical protein FACS1894137_05070 [Spirochaetia bacterium]|nr:hypothetical protein FACS1894137_05070 [Spirochaetia bacterium]
MNRIKIKNFGPIHKGCTDSDGFIDIKKLTLFIGSQGSGKSTVAKLISTFTWIEKALMRGDYDIKWFERKGRFKNQLLRYHRLENYVGLEKAYIEYQGPVYSFYFSDNSLLIQEEGNSLFRDAKQNKYALPQIMYIPAERNFLSYIKKANELKLYSPSLQDFLTEFNNAKQAIKGFSKLPLNNTDIEYDRLNDNITIKTDQYKIRISDAASGFQSFIPLFLVSQYLADSVKSKGKEKKDPMSEEEMKRFRKSVEDIWQNENLSDEQKKIAISTLSSKFNKIAFINIVEEPEQNLFPLSQRTLLNSLLKLVNQCTENKLIMTTHSPYIINFLSIAIQGKHLKEKINGSQNSDFLFKRLNKIVPLNALIGSEDTAVYQLNETDGSIQKLPMPNGIPSDRNYLNNMLGEGNRLFDELLEIEEEL